VRTVFPRENFRGGENSGERLARCGKRDVFGTKYGRGSRGVREGPKKSCLRNDKTMVNVWRRYEGEARKKEVV